MHAIFRILAAAAAFAATAPAPNYEIRIFSAEWCHPCRELHKLLKKLGLEKGVQATVAGKSVFIPVRTIDVTHDEDGSLAASMGGGIGTLPEVVVMKDGKRFSFVEYEDLFPGSSGVNFTREGFAHAISKTIALGEKFAASDPIAKAMRAPRLASKSFTLSGVVLLGTGKGQDETPVFIGDTIKKVKARLLGDLAVPESSLITLYAQGPQSKDDDAMATSEIPYHGDLNDDLYEKAGNGHRTTYGMVRGEYSTKIPGVGADLPADTEALASSFRQLREGHAPKVLAVLVGHGARTGIRVGNREFSAEHMRKFTSAIPAQTVIVSGVCYGGQFALSASCGFFGARPDTIAAGCSADPADEVKDYASTFFNGIDPAARATADANKDGKLSFSEAHWFAVANGDPHDVPFTSLDALAERYFAESAESLPEHLTVGRIRELAAAVGDPGEQAAARSLGDEVVRKDKDVMTVYLKNADISFDSTIEGRPIHGHIVIDPFADAKGGGSRDADRIELDTPSMRALDEIREKGGFKRLSMRYGTPPTYENRFNEKTQAWEYGVVVPKPAANEVVLLGEKEAGTQTPPVLGKVISLPVETYDLSRLYPEYGTGLYRPALVQLARRLVFKDLIAKKQGIPAAQLAEVDRIRKCEDQPIEDFLGTPALKGIKLGNGMSIPTHPIDTGTVRKLVEDGAQAHGTSSGRACAATGRQ